MPLAGTSSPQTLPRIVLALDEAEAACVRTAWQFVATHGDEAAIADRVRTAAERVVADPIVIAFGGHWNAGKSTLLNALLGRDLLPVSERTETGAACRIRAGVTDEAVSLRDGRSVPIPCTREAIEEEVSITGGRAEPREKIGAVERVDLRLADAPIPPNVCWVDTSGLNDSAAADERLLREADRADQLLWVLNPDQHLAEVEQQFLAAHVERRGIESIAFLVNVRTRIDPGADWNRFHDEALRGHRSKIENFWRRAGLSAEAFPPILVASGAHLREEFGAREIRRFLDGSDGLLSRRVRAVRIGLLKRSLAEATSEIERRMEEVRAREAQQQRLEADRQRRLLLFRDRATRDVMDIVASMTEPLRATAAQIARVTQSSTVQSETAIGQRLTAEWHRLLEERWSAVVACFHSAAARADFAAPSARAMSVVAADLAVPAIRIPPPAATPATGCTITAWGCAGPMALILLLVAFAADSSGPLVVAMMLCGFAALITSITAGQTRARNLAHRLDTAIHTAMTAYTAQVSAAVNHVADGQDFGRAGGV